jgi:glycosyltransferase involved in cell wall biosynthesis
VRVGLVIYGGLDLVSGGFLYDRMVVRELRARGVEVEVIALPWRRFGGALAENLLPWPAALQRCDVVVEDQLVHPAVFARHDRLRPPVVALVHNLTHPPGAPRSLPAAVERQYFSTVAGVIAVCENTLAEVRAVAGPRPAVVARAGGDHVPAAGAELPRFEGPLRLLFVGTVMPHKGLHRLFEALAPLPASSFALEVVGSLTADARYAAALAASGDRHGVRWHGQLEGEALWAAYRRSHLLVLPSDREAYSLACLEALAFGLPVLVSDRGGMREMISGNEGLTLSPADPAAWTAALRALAADRPRLRVMSAAAQARHAQHGRWRDTAAGIEGFLASLLAERSS